MPDKKRYKGIIKFFSYRRGYGFIVPESREIKEDVFFHFSSISSQPGMIVYLIPNERIDFELVKGPRGYLAKNVASKNKIREKSFDKKVNNIYYHYYYSFRKIMDGMIESEIDKNEAKK
ncbi:hypothetical protein COBT_001758 [Conglomerata obtusa]